MYGVRISSMKIFVNEAVIIPGKTKIKPSNNIMTRECICVLARAFKNLSIDFVFLVSTSFSVFSNVITMPVNEELSSSKLSLRLPSAGSFM